MSSIIDIIDRLKPRKQSRFDEDIVFGLPLDVDGRQIYPMYREIGSTEHAEQRQPMGYLEIAGGRADYTRLEPDYAIPAALVILASIAVVSVWLLRRLIAGRT